MNFNQARVRTRRVVATALSVLVTLTASIFASSPILAAPLIDPEPPTETPVAQETLRARFLADQLDPEPLEAMGLTPCLGGMAGSYPCDNVDLLAFMPLANIGGGSGNDIWGWTDPLDGKEYAIMGRTSGTSFVDISDPLNPVYLGNLPPHTSNSSWRDIKVYANHAFIVSEASGHGMQVFDLTALRSVISPPVTFAETTHYNGFGSAHNLVINEDSGFAFAVGSNTCSGGLHMVDISTPTSPTGAGCFSSDGYTHDAQCVIYAGPDTEHQGSEICFNANEDTLTIVDVSNKSSPVQLSRTSYAGVAYTHQGWLTADHTHFLLDDELDEQSFGTNTRTFIWDVTDLDLPTVIGIHTGPTAAIDHNQYIHSGFSYQANYRSGLRILDASLAASGILTETAYFDIYPSSNSASFNGAWSVYPYYTCGVVVVSGIEQGLFVLQPQLEPDAGVALAPANQSRTGSPGDVVTHTLTLTNTGTVSDTYTLSLSGDTWQTSAPATTGNLLPGESFTFDVTVEIPAQPAGGVIIATDSFRFLAESAADPGACGQAVGTTHANIFPGADLGPDQAKSGSLGSSLGYIFKVTNAGSYTDTFSLAASGVWTATVSTASTPTLPPGASASVTVTVQLPASPAGGSSDITTVTARSGWDNSLQAQASATSNLLIFPMHLPWVSHE